MSNNNPKVNINYKKVATKIQSSKPLKTSVNYLRILSRYQIRSLFANINSIRNKFGDLDKIMEINIGILCVAEVILEKSFPRNQFFLSNSFIIPLGLDITDTRGKLLNHMYLQEGFEKVFDSKIPSNIQMIAFKKNIQEESCIIIINITIDLFIFDKEYTNVCLCQAKTK